jgi:crotonobetainyl-CoA:carnitine CoA-transferase CaiB-like acyl-CoA transferase
MATNSVDGAASAGALDGLKVLDLSHIASGPFATMVLADMGADVLKVEKVEFGDGSRQMDQAIRGTDSGYYLGLNKNKRSIALDLSTDEGRSVVRKLAMAADVLIENFRPGAADRLGLGYLEMSASNPALIYCSITGFGSEGAMRGDTAYDIIGQAVSGIMSITGDPDRPPAKCGAPIADLTSGLFAAVGILAALAHRERTGEGQHVGSSLLGSSAALLSSYVTSQALGTPFDRVGSAHNTLAPYQAFRGADGKYFILAAGNDTFFSRTAQTIGRPDLAADQRFATNALRSRNRETLSALLGDIFGTRSASEWIDELRAAEVPVSAILDIAEMVTSPQLLVNNYIVHVDQPDIGVLPMIATPITFSSTPVSLRRPAPKLDEHHAEIIEIANDPDLWTGRA